MADSCPDATWNMCFPPGGTMQPALATSGSEFLAGTLQLEFLEKSTRVANLEGFAYCRSLKKLRGVEFFVAADWLPWCRVVLVLPLLVLVPGYPSKCAPK
eukprot:2838803-Rhodomonas_salina.2